MRRALLVLLVACGKHAAPVAEPGVEIAVTTAMPGASPDVMATSVATPLEQALAQIEGLVRLHSRSSDGVTRVVAEFPGRADGFEAAEKVRTAVSAVLRQLPSQIDSPIVSRTGRRDAVMRIVARSSALSAVDLSSLVQRVVLEKLAAVNGVGEIYPCGAVDASRTVEVDPAAVAARNVSLLQLIDKIERVASREELVAEVRDVATVAERPQPPRCVAFDAGGRFVALTVRPQPGANPVEVRAGLERMLAEVTPKLPVEIKLDVWPATQPVALDVRFGPDVKPEAAVARIQKALPRTGHVLAQLEGDTAELRFVPPADAAAIRSALAGETILEPTDHVVGIAGADPTAILAYAELLAGELARAPGLHVVDRMGFASAPVDTYEIDRDAAARFATPVADIATILRALVPGGTRVAMRTLRDQVAVYVAVSGLPTDALELLRIGPVPLSSLVKVTRTPGPAIVFHEARVPWVGLRVNGSVDALDTALAKQAIPAGIHREVRAPD